MIAPVQNVKDDPGPSATVTNGCEENGDKVARLTSSSSSVVERRFGSLMLPVLEPARMVLWRGEPGLRRNSGDLLTRPQGEAVRHLMRHRHIHKEEVVKLYSVIHEKCGKDPELPPLSPEPFCRLDSEAGY